MRSRPRAEAASSNLLALHRAVQKLAPTPHGTRARFAAIHKLISSFRVRGAHHEHQRDPRDAAEEGRRQWRAFLKGFAFTPSPSSRGPRPRPQKGPAALPGQGLTRLPQTPKVRGVGRRQVVQGLWGSGRADRCSEASRRPLGFVGRGRGLEVG